MRLMTLNESVQMQLMPFIAPIVEKIDDKSTAEEQRAKEILMHANLLVEN